MSSLRYFVSYSRRDEESVRAVCEHLRDAGVDLWLDVLDIPAGTRWDRAVEQALLDCSGMLLMLSRAAVSSENVLDELHFALEQRRQLIPVLLEPCRVPYRVSRIEYVDLHGHRAAELERLAALLAAGEAPHKRDADAEVNVIDQSQSRRMLPSLAVLPLRVASAAEETTMLADGLHEDISGALARHHDLFVISASTTRSLSDHSRTPGELAAELGVRYLVTGRVQAAGNKLRVAMGMTDAETGEDIWSDRFDAMLTDIFDVQDRITRAVVHQLVSDVRHRSAARLDALSPEELSAWELVARARLFDPGKMDRKASVEHLQRAISLKPDFAEAHGLLGALIVDMRWIGRFDQLPTALAHAEKAIELAPRDPECLQLAARVFRGVGDYKRAGALVQHALDLNPNSADAWALNGACLALNGHNEEGLEMLAYALELSPRDARRYIWHAEQAICHINLHDYEHALEAILLSNSLYPQFFWGQLCEAQCRAMLSQPAEALESWQRAKALNTAMTLRLFASLLKNSALDAEHQARVVGAMEAAGCA